MHMEDWGSQENYVWIYMHSKEIGSSGVLLATATQQRLWIPNVSNKT